MNEKGTLYLVATPIGNLEDITLRAIRTLREADIIAAEDTRQTMKLLNHFSISVPVTSYYEHNKITKGNILINYLLEGKNVALVSDAGSPGISDPGEDLVKLAIENSIKVSMVPGAVAAITGLIISGMPTGRFVFEGFLPMNKRVRKERLEFLRKETRTIVLYEAPHKLLYTLKDISQFLGNRRIAMARELTKLHEEVIRCTVEEAIEKYSLEPPRGEYVLIIEAADEMQAKEEKEKTWEQMNIREHVEMYINAGMGKKEAMKKAAEDRGLSKRDIYKSMLEEDCSNEKENNRNEEESSNKEKENDNNKEDDANNE